MSSRVVSSHRHLSLDRDEVGGAARARLRGRRDDHGHERGFAGGDHGGESRARGEATLPGMEGSGRYAFSLAELVDCETAVRLLSQPPTPKGRQSGIGRTRHGLTPEGGMGLVRPPGYRAAQDWLPRALTWKTRFTGRTRPTAGRRCARPAKPRRTDPRPSPGFVSVRDELGAIACAAPGAHGKRGCPTYYPAPAIRLEDVVNRTPSKLQRLHTITFPPQSIST